LCPPARAVALFAFDVGSAIDLPAAAARLAGSSRATLSTPGTPGTPRMPDWFQFRPLPLSIRQPVTLPAVAGHSVSGEAELTLYDFGAVSVTLTIPLPELAGTTPDPRAILALLPLGEALYENPVLRAAAAALVEGLVTTLGPAIRKRLVSELVEDYTVYLLPSPVAAAAGEDGPTIETFLEAPEFRRAMAQLLAAESAPLSRQEADDAVAGAVCFGRRDAVVADWAAAMVFGTPTQATGTGDAADGNAAVLEVLRFANVELLEMRFMDDRLDAMLDEAYELQAAGRLGTAGKGVLRRAITRLRDVLPGSRSHEVEKLATMQVDAAVLFESVSNALKLVGEPYLARVYRLAASRLHLASFETSIQRKQATLGSIYDKLANSASSHRMEILEWIVILLIAFEIVMPILGWK
jgi:hypothetical protein